MQGRTIQGVQRSVSTDANKINKDRFRELFGFSLSDLSSWEAVIRLLFRPEDPASLALLRVFFGILMVMDTIHERGLHRVSEIWGDPDQCQFPLFDFLKPLPVEWMCMVYLSLILSALGICLGLMYRINCLIFVICYWYLFLLNKTAWNNHSYLYGLMGILLLITDANRCWSVDGLLFPRKRHAHVPLWNYTLFRFQIFIVYFIAGLKKLDMDWVQGYSVSSIEKHWVFHPFRLVMSDEVIDLFIIHIGGLIIDLSMGFLLFFDKTRKIAFFFLSSFHLMNSQIFSIGMFPWMMLATMPLFCSNDWPRKFFQKLPLCLKFVTPQNHDLQTSDHCLYSKEDIKPETSGMKTKSVSSSASPPATKPRAYHKLFTMVTGVYILIQCCLPYSHGITKGNNAWTKGLYGYSWDMMVHSWSLQHVRVTYYDLNSGDTGYLNPTAWSKETRWTFQPDMAMQYAACIADHLQKYNLKSIKLNFDVWRSLNKRFQQRMYDPRVDLLTADWNLFRKTPWIMPLLVDLSDWRTKLREIEKNLMETSSNADVVFVADFPGLFLENFVHSDLKNTSITLLKGEVTVEIQKHNFTLKEGEQMQLPFNEFHTVHTVSTEPSCYMYIFVNTTDVEFQRNLTLYEQMINHTIPQSEIVGNVTLMDILNGIKLRQYQQMLQDKFIQQETSEMSLWQQFNWFINSKYSIVTRSCKFLLGALTSIVTRQPFEEIMNKTSETELASRNNKETEQIHAVS
ncbi:hypothetical protein ACJMK2_033680 [Sinanodonta woodiana]|uniref:Vitamin K-dependent gamma-carboxylase n=1 Tax=Sinanodonta woodiana TaxID=1069815 RepID=A0ABD3WP52_SINWO